MDNDDDDDDDDGDDDDDDDGDDVDDDDDDKIDTGRQKSRWNAKEHIPRRRCLQIVALIDGIQVFLILSPFWPGSTQSQLITEQLTVEIPRGWYR